MDSTVLSIASASRSVYRYLNDTTHLLGIGNTKSTSPLPIANPYDVDVPDLIGYVPVTYLYAVIDNPNGDIITSDSRYNRILDAPNTFNLIANNCTQVYLECFINHSNLPSSLISYSAVGIYTGCIIDPLYVDSLSTDSFIPKERIVSSYLDTIQQFSYVTRKKGVTHKVQIVRGFS